MKYKAFGLILDSEIELIQIPAADESCPADVWIRYANLSERGIDFNQVYIGPQEFRVCPQNLANLRVTDGRLIEVEVLNPDMPHICVFLMGSCMGAILHQRGYLPIHGSCVTDGEHAILISGDSGAGKSTTAAEFLKHGWKLLTDDVVLLKDIERGHPLVQSSYPSQKLWQDSLRKYDRRDEDIHSLYEREDRSEVKYGVDVSEMFYEGCVPLTLFIRLYAGEKETWIEEVDGFGKVVQFQHNTYRPLMVEDKQKHFQRCVDLGTRIPMIYAYRNQEEDTTEQIYHKVMEILGGLDVD